MGFASSSLFAQYPDLTKQELKKSKIKDISEHRHSPCDFDRERSTADQWKAGMWSDSRRGYDSRGNLDSEYYFSKFSAAPDIVAYKYDDNDSLVEKTVEPINYPVVHKITRNDKGKILEDIYSSERHTFKYNATGDVIEEAVFATDDGSLLDKKTYNDKGYLIDALIYDSNDIPARHAKIVYTYDRAGHRTIRGGIRSGGPSLFDLPLRLRPDGG
jgi:hypothetical protein